MRRAAFVAPLLAAASLLAACSSADKPTLTDAQADDAELVTGEQVYQDSCARCHGEAGGGGAGPKLSDGRVVEDFPEAAAQAEVIRVGRGAMPAWEGTLSPEQIDAVVRYTREVL
jgi:mono/diheme cytochrome c family protein